MRARARTRKKRQTATELEQKVDELERLIHGIIALGGKDLVERAKQYCTLNIGTLKAETLTDMLGAIADHERRRQLEEYKKLIESNNKNNNH